VAGTTHPNKKEGEPLLRDAEKQGWRVIRPGRYFKLYCPCPEEHMETVHITPSNPNYFREKRRHLRRTTCWREAEK
jgi:hypothetical protein